MLDDIKNILAPESEWIMFTSATQSSTCQGDTPATNPIGTTFDSSWTGTCSCTFDADEEWW